MGNDLGNLTDSLIAEKKLSKEEFLEKLLSRTVHNPNFFGTVFGLGIGFNMYKGLGADSNFDIVNGIIGGAISGLEVNMGIRVVNLFRKLDDIIDESSKLVIEVLKDPKAWGVLAATAYMTVTGKPIYSPETLASMCLGYCANLAATDIGSFVNKIMDNGKEFKSKIKKKAKEGIEWVINHPKISGVASVIAFFENIPVHGINLIGESIKKPVGFAWLPWYLGYIPFALAKEYGLHKELRITIPLPEKTNPIKKLYYQAINNPKLAGLVSGITGGTLIAGSYSTSWQQFIAQFVLWSNIFGAGGQLLFNQVKYNKMIMSAAKEQERPQRNGLAKVLTATDLVFEHPIYAGLITATAHRIETLTKINHSSDDYLLLAFSSLVIAAFISLGINISGPFLHSQSAKKTWNSLYSHTCSTLGFYDKATKAWERAMEVPTTSSQKSRDKLHYADLLLKTGKGADRVIREQQEAARIIENNELGINHLDLLKSITGINRTITKLNQGLYNITKNPMKGLNLGLAMIGEKRYDEGFEILESIYQKMPEDPVVNSIYGYALISAGRKEQGRKHFQNIAKNLDNMSVISDLRHFGGSKTYQISDPNLHNMFVFKEDDPVVLEGEMDSEKKLSKKVLSSKYSKSYYKTVEPIDIIQLGDKRYYVMLMEPGELLADAAKHDISHLLKASGYQGFIHGTMTEKLVKDGIDQKARIYKRLKEDIIIDEKLKQELFENIDPTIGSNGHLVFERDGHPYQWIVTKKGIIAIDLEYRGYNREEDDNAKLLFQGYFLSREAESYKTIERILNENISMRNKVALEELKIYDENEFIRKTLRATPRKAISYYFFARNKPETSEVRKDFLKNGVFAIELIEDKFFEHYSQIEMKQFEKLKHGMNSLIQIND